MIAGDWRSQQAHSYGLCKVLSMPLRPVTRVATIGDGVRRGRSIGTHTTIDWHAYNDLADATRQSFVY